MKQKHLDSTLKKGEFCFNVPSVFIKGKSLCSAQQDSWDSHLTFDAYHLMVAPIIYEDEHGPYYGPVMELSKHAKIHQITNESERTPICSFREVHDDEYRWKYGAIFFRLGDTVDRIKREFGHDAFVLVDSEALLSRINAKMTCCARSVHYGDIDEEFQKYIDATSESQAAMFQKRNEYQWQQEYRIILQPNEDKDRVFVEVGPIEDIAVGGILDLLRDGIFLAEDECHVGIISYILSRDNLTINDILSQDKMVTGDKKMQYLSEEEQFQEILNNGQISRIKDPILREIRSKYWNLRHKAFKDEHNISDSNLDQIWEQLKEQEKAELDAYRRSYQKIETL